MRFSMKYCLYMHITRTLNVFLDLFLVPLSFLRKMFITKNFFFLEFVVYLKSRIACIWDLHTEFSRFF